MLLLEINRLCNIDFLTIELFQLVTQTGLCGTDDVICDTIGCLIFMGAFMK